MDEPGANEEAVPRLARVGVTGQRKARLSNRGRRKNSNTEPTSPAATHKRKIVYFDRLPLLPLRLIYDFLAPNHSPKAAYFSSSEASGMKSSSEQDTDQEAKGNTSVAATSTATTAATKQAFSDHTVLFCLSRRLAFQFNDAINCKEFFTAETVRRVLNAKDCRRFMRSIHKAQLLIRTELKINEWGCRGYSKYHMGMNYACSWNDTTPRISAQTAEEFLTKQQQASEVRKRHYFALPHN